MSTPRILVVDDEEAIVTAWRRALTTRGYWVRGVTSATEAIRECDEHRFDIVLADFIMPEMHGVELLRQIRQRLPLIRSILVSGKLDTDVPERAITEVAGVECDCYLHKPVETARLVEEIEALFARGASGDWKEAGKQATQAGRIRAKNSAAAAREIRRVAKKRRKRK